MLLETVTTTFTKALQQGNSSQGTFQILPILGGQNPLQVYGNNAAGNGVVDLGEFGAGFTQNRLQLIPYADGPTGSTFNFRLYGWDAVRSQDYRPFVWVPFLLAEFQCTTSAITGVKNYTITDTEHVCDFIKLVNGTTGTTGFAGGLVNSPAATGTNLVAYALVTLSGCRFVQFDFQKSSNVTMNCLWASA